MIRYIRNTDLTKLSVSLYHCTYTVLYIYICHNINTFYDIFIDIIIKVIYFSINIMIS